MGAVKNFAKFTGAPLLEPFLLKKKLWHRCFPVNFAKFLRISIFIEHLQWLILYNFTEFRNQNVNPIQDGLFRGCSRMEEGGRPPVHKICHTYATMMKLGTVIPYLKKVKKIYESRDTPLEFCRHQHFFTGNQQILLYQEMQI